MPGSVDTKRAKIPYHGLIFFSQLELHMRQNATSCIDSARGHASLEVCQVAGWPLSTCELWRATLHETVLGVKSGWL